MDVGRSTKWRPKAAPLHFPYKIMPLFGIYATLHALTLTVYILSSSSSSFLVTGFLSSLVRLLLSQW
jgi:hypothetical protein